MPVNDLGTVKPGSTLYLPFHTFDSNDPSASVTLTGLATTDIEIYKDGSATQRASDAGYALLDTDGIDFDSITGIHGLSVDLADNTTAGFYEAGSRYWVVVSSVTVDAATINFVLATFTIGYPGALLDTTLASLASQTSFTLEDGSADNDAYNGCIAYVHDVASAVQVAIGVVSDYVGSTKTVTLSADPGIFTMAAGDNISLFPPALLPTTAGRTLDVTATGAAGIDWANVENQSTAVDLSGTDIQLVDTTTTNTDMRGTDNAALASVLGALTDAGAAGDPTSVDTVVQYIKQLVNVLVGSQGIVSWPAAAAPGANVSMAEALRAVYDDTNSLDGTKVPDTLSLANINAEADTALSDMFTSSAQLVDDIWDEATAGHATAGTTGKALTDAGSAGDPWSTVLPGAYGAGTAGKIVGDNINAPLATIDTVVDGIQTDLDNGTDGLGAIKTAVDAIPTSNPTAAAIADQVWDETLADHLGAGSTGNALNAAGGAGDPWSTALPGAYGAGTAGKIVGDNINAPIGTVDTVVDAIKAVTDNLPESGALTTIDANVDAVLADTADMQPKLGTPAGADMSADIAAVKAETATIVADTNELQTDDVPGLIAGLNDVSAAQVNAEVVDALNVDTYAEPAQGTPGATISLAAKIGYLFKAWRNKSDQDATTYQLYNDDAATVDHKATVSDDGTTATKGEVITGP